MIWNVASARVSQRKWFDGTVHLRTFRVIVGCKECILLAAMLLFHSRFLHIVSTRYGQTCSIEESFAENQKHQRAAKPFCSVNKNTQVLH